MTSEKLSGTNSLFHPFSLSESPNTNYEAIKALTNKTLANKKCECNPEWPLLIVIYSIYIIQIYKIFYFNIFTSRNYLKTVI